MIIVPVTFSISIVKYNILDIDLIVRRSTVYFIVVSLLISIYAIIVGFTVLLIGSFTIKASLIASVALAILIPLLFDPLRRFVQKEIDRKFFHVSYNYRLAQRQFLDELNDCFSINAIGKMVVEKLDTLLNPEIIQMHLRSKNRQRWPLLAGIKSISIQENTFKEMYGFDKKSNGSVYTMINYIESDIEYTELPSRLFKNDQIVLIAPIRSQNKKHLGYLLCGRKKSETRFSLEDIDLLSTISIQTGIRVEKILLQQELILKREETEKLEELNKAKSFFVSSVSHDLQTPLTSIKMFSELLREKKDLSAEKRDEFVSVIENESERLSRLIKNILDLSQIERGVKSYDFRDVDLNTMINKVVQLMRFSIEQNGFVLNLDVLNEPVFISADEDAVISCIVNLISNAMKYSLVEKEILIRTAKENDCALVAISDKGVGISEEEQDKIFETFYRSDNEQLQNVAGVGLGLTITSHIIKAHKGRITIKSKPDTGSTFTLLFPLI
jgi:signal transduction histidine kinase